MEEWRKDERTKAYPKNNPEKKKTRRPARHGNRNARGNRGNPDACGQNGNRGGRGASVGNEFARKTGTLEMQLRLEYGTDPQVLKWIEEHRDVLSRERQPTDSALDRAMYLGLPLKE